MAVSLLESFGKESWPVLRNIAKRKRPDCELFLRLIAECSDTSATDRISALIALTSHPDRNVRYQIIEVLDSFSNEDKKRVLQKLVTDADADVRERAEENLSFLNC